MQTFTEFTGSNKPIDTLAIAKYLQSSGMPKKQAEAQAEVLGNIIDSNLATKQDLKKVQSDLKAEMAKIAGNLETKILETKAEIIKWVVPLLIGQTAVLAALVKFL